MRRVLISVVLAALAARANAQSVPGFAVEATGGFGPHTSTTNATYYSDDPVALVRFAATIRLGPAGAIRPTLTVEHAPQCALGLCGDRVNCIVAPNGRCFQPFAMPSGNAVGLGVGGNWHDAVFGNVSGGAAWYAQRAWYVDASVAFPLWSHVAIVADARRIATTDDLGARTWLVPISAGLRVF